jgi:Sodium/hydrogen exchanger family
MFTLVLSGYVLMYFPHHDISFDGNWFLRIMVPPIVFEAALSIDKRSFNRHIVPIVIFSVVGTLTATVVTAYVVHRGTTALSRYCTPIPAVEALTFGALISSIDPIAVLSVLSNMGMTDTDTIYVLIFGESVRTRHESACSGSVFRCSSMRVAHTYPNSFSRGTRCVAFERRSEHCSVSDSGALPRRQLGH